MEAVEDQTRSESAVARIADLPPPQEKSFPWRILMVIGGRVDAFLNISTDDVEVIRISDSSIDGLYWLTRRNNSCHVVIIDIDLPDTKYITDHAKEAGILPILVSRKLPLDSATLGGQCKLMHGASVRAKAAVEDNGKRPRMKWTVDQEKALKSIIAESGEDIQPKNALELLKQLGETTLSLSEVQNKLHMMRKKGKGAGKKK